jgi:hypothetical protein
MARRKWSILAVALVLPLLLAACGGTDSRSSAEDPASVEPVAGTELNRITLSQQAAQRLDVRTEEVNDGPNGTQRKVVPYSAVLYTPTGETWVYVSEAPLTFVRERVVVERIDGRRAILSTGPPAGTKVVTVAVAELYGTESGVGGDY